MSDKLKTLTMTHDDVYRIVAADARRRRLAGNLSPEMSRQAAAIEESCLDEIEGRVPSVN
jgi:hypothetical protein